MNLLRAIEGFGQRFMGYVASFAQAFLFLMQLLVALPMALLRTREWLRQLYFVGVLSLLIVIIAGFFVGMVLALQGYNILVSFNATEVVGQMVALSLLRELGPVVAALLFAGRAGSALTAELGLMRSTEQLSALEMMGIDPMKRIFAPRFIAVMLALPMLAMLFSAAGIIGGYLVAVPGLSIDEGAFWAQIQASVGWDTDVYNSMIKAAVFAFTIALVALYQGISAKPTAEGVSMATTRTVVYSSLLVLGLDFVLTALMFK